MGWSEDLPHLREFETFLDVLGKESDRGAVLISAVMIDDLLERSILGFLIKCEETKRLLNGFNAPLGTLSSRSLAAFALGLLSESEYKECERLRKIRNIFAHDFKVTFEDQSVKDLCANLEYAAPSYDMVVVDAKGQYVTAAVGLIASLTNRPAYAAQRRLKYGKWPC
jgi:mannitol operon repressor